MIRLGSLATLATAALLLGACAGTTTSSPEADASGDSALTTTGERDLAAYVNQDFSWDTCDRDWLIDATSAAFEASEVECGTVLVPATYEGNQDIPDFAIAVMRVVRETSDANPDTGIFINPGGPGGSGIEQVQNSNFPEDLHNAFPFIGFDPRGVGFSDFADGTEIECSDELDYLSYFGEASPANEAELDASIAELDQYYEDCVESNPYWWTLSTDNVAKDLELLRSVLTPGEPLNFIGSSYGTTIAGRYVSFFPEQVGKVVFDSPTTVDQDRIESALVNFAANEVKLEKFLEGYATYAEISFDEAWERVLTVRQKADDEQLIGFAGYEPSERSPGNMVSSEALFVRGILTLNYYPEDVSQNLFNAAMDDAYFSSWNGTFEWLGFSLDGYDPDSLEGSSLDAKDIIRSNEYEVRVIVNTMDYAPEPLTTEEQIELNERAEEVAPLLSTLYSDASGYEYVGPPKGVSWDDFANADPLIPDPPTTPFVPSNPSGAQLLIVGSIDESVTPYSFAQDTAELLDSPLLSVESSRHAPVAFYNNTCVNEVVSAYFLETSPVVDTTCGE